jgi:hypothetical protein
MRNRASARQGALRRHLALAVILPLALVAAACGGDDDTSAIGSGPGVGAGGMTISVVAPQDGAVVEVPFDVRIDASVDLGASGTGLHHVHLYYDGKIGPGDVDAVFGTSFTVDRPLGPGRHTIKAVVANPDHSLTGASDEITINVRAPG